MYLEGNTKVGGTARAVLVVLGMLLLAGVVVVAILRDRIINKTYDQVSVLGRGKVVYQSDIAEINLGVQIDKVLKASDALAQLNNKINKVIPAIQALGIAPEDLQTQNYTLYAQYDYANNSSQLAGYNANQQLLVKVRNLKENPDRVGKVIAEATKAGVNQVNGINFEISNLEDLKQEARIKAIEDARNKAQALSQALGVKLGSIASWWENIIQAPGYPSPYGYGIGGGGMGAGKLPSTPAVPVSSQEIVIEVNVSYHLN